MHEYLPRVLALLVTAERQRGGFLVVPHDLPAALEAVGQDGEHQWFKVQAMLDAEGYFAQARPPTTAKRVLTSKAHALASQA
jgi:hypothetical protein